MGCNCRIDVQCPNNSAYFVISYLELFLYKTANSIAFSAVAAGHACSTANSRLLHSWMHFTTVRRVVATVPKHVLVVPHKTL